ncbi:hypothetical protein FE782_00305 [Paenibacillus antri]|uniref:Glycoside hydrolase 35 catalytic domain-containing protein n=1 Tax=Paenibacillus antri TaxID=2582848 RepID=A0A5R9GK54_9BACL|nr:beta-galactosidase [Paenibacillus antri]TLS53838.1 hypothetical protein FE782_00305 [Paenibacillus antri]
MTILTSSSVALSSTAIRIDGESKIVLCASLFYFRIPSELWQERLQQIKSCGYTCIDVYFPWNFHELAEGAWDFSGERDVEKFLRLAADAGLQIVARPGPYICSEWDGGALPAYLYPMEDVKLRDNNPGFLRHVARWFDRIMPLLARYQLGGTEQGTVICVQLDNELDFFGCADPAGYIAALRDMALSHGITVPLIACAGQGGLAAASGFAEGVVPTCNFYPRDRDPDLDAKVLAYRAELAEMGLPLMVTETNRSHFLLRRLLAGGAKLLGPYLQVSGTNFGFTNATNNWGKPLAFLASDYDFGGMISPDGILRPEAYEARLLSRLIAAYGAPLAEAVPGAGSPPAALIAHRGTASGPNELRLQGGGSLLFVANTGEGTAELELTRTGAEEGARLWLMQDRCIALPYRIPLAHWELEGTLLYATAELFDIRTVDGKTEMLFHTEGSAEIAIALEGAVRVEAEGIAVNQLADFVRMSFDDSGSGACRFHLTNGHVLEILTMSREIALQSGIAIADETRTTATAESLPLAARWSEASIDPTLPMTAVGQRSVSQADYLEKFGIYRGYAWYEAEWKEAAKGAIGLLLHKAGDVVSLYDGPNYLGTLTPGGASAYIPLERPLIGKQIMARTEIWGHSNFDDARLPALRIGGMRGLRGLTAVTGVRDLNGNWRYAPADPANLAERPDEVFDAPVSRPIVEFGGWLSAQRFSREWFARSFTASEGSDAWVLHFEGLDGVATVFVNGRMAGAAQPLDPFVDITPFVLAGEAVELAVLLERHLGRPAGRVHLLEGSEAAEWRLSGAEESELLAHALRAKPSSVAAALPIALQPGAVAWVYGSLPLQLRAGRGLRISVEGSFAKATVFLDGRLVARIWTQGGASRPHVTGGSQDSFFVPGAWLTDEAELLLLLEAIDVARPAELRELRFKQL